MDLCAPHIQAESGLLTATVMGIAIANQKWVFVEHIIEFKENLQVLLLSFLFILLSARLEVGMTDFLAPPLFLFLALLILVARPAAVFLSTLGSRLNWKERIFLSWMAPRGIVAAAVSAIFAIRLSEAERADTEQLVPLTFFVIIGTIVIYGLTASPLAQWLGLAEPHPLRVC